MFFASQIVAAVTYCNKMSTKSNWLCIRLIKNILFDQTTVNYTIMVWGR